VKIFRQFKFFAYPASTALSAHTRTHTRKLVIGYIMQLDCERTYYRRRCSRSCTSTGCRHCRHCPRSFCICTDDI